MLGLITAALLLQIQAIRRPPVLMSGHNWAVLLLFRYLLLLALTLLPRAYNRPWFGVSVAVAVVAAQVLLRALSLHQVPGGGGGATSESLISAPVSTAITIGTAGAGGVGAANGSNGGVTSFGSLVIAGAGAFGFSVAGATTERITIGGFGGSVTAGTGDIKFAGSPGANAISNTILTTLGGAGGSSSSSGGGPAVFINGDGGTAEAFGGGGGGALSKSSGAAADGGDGAPGLVVVTEFI